MLGIAVKQPLPIIESAIASRLRGFRESIGLTRAEMADALGIGLERLASYEDSRAPLRWEVFARIAKRYGVNPRWLARFDVHIFAPFSEALLELPISPRALFSKAFEEHLESRIPTEFSGDELRPDSLCDASAEVIEQLRNLAVSPTANQRAVLSAKWFAPRMSSIQTQLGFWLGEAAKLPAAKSKGEGEDFHDEKAQGSPDVLYKVVDVLENSEHPSAMANVTWEELRERLRAVTKSRGAKTAIANDLHVSRQAINKWLDTSKGSEPLANTYLAILDWVRRAEKNQ